jgi:hypothetical protein
MHEDGSLPSCSFNPKTITQKQNKRRQESPKVCVREFPDKKNREVNPGSGAGLVKVGLYEHEQCKYGPTSNDDQMYSEVGFLSFHVL